MGLFFTERLNHDVQIGVWRIEEGETDLKKGLFLDDHYRGARWASLTSSKRRIEFLAVRVLLKTLIGHEEVIEYTNEGMPLMKNGGFVSISHSMHFVSVIVSATSPVSIDIELIDERVCRLKDRFLNASEQKLLQIKDMVSSYGTTLLWSGKESLYKVSQSPLKSDYKEQLEILEISDGMLVGRVAQNEKYSIGVRIIDDFVMTFIYL